jgi:hypothetical protein
LKIDCDDFLGFAVFQRGEDRLEQTVRRIYLSASRNRRRAVDDALSGFRWCQGFYLSSYHPRSTACLHDAKHYRVYKIRQGL